MSYLALENKKEEYRKYLETSGVLDKLTKVLVQLYETAEKPDDPVGYLREFLASGDRESLRLRQENEALKARVAELEERLREAGVDVNVNEPAGESQTGAASVNGLGDDQAAAAGATDGATAPGPATATASA